MLHRAVIAWYDVHARVLPWRKPGCSPWGVLVSEVMLQQTPVARVLPAWSMWMDRWPSAGDLAADSPAEAIRMWGRLGYPRRAIRLHSAAGAIVARHGGQVPSDHGDLLALPGIGSYTAAAVASFAFGGRHTVVDTNVRRVFARAISGVQFPAATLTAAETRLAETLLPQDAAMAARWGAASMELGAVLCTARKARCDLCPIAPQCVWVLDGRPDYDGPTRRSQGYEGTDRQMRGWLLAALRTAEHPLAESALLATGGDRERAVRCLASLVDDALVSALTGERYELPRA